MKDYSIISQVGMRIGDDRFFIIDNRDGKLFLNDVEVLEDFLSPEFENFSIEYQGSRRLITNYWFHLGEGKKINIRANNRNKMLFVNMSGAFPEGTSGLLGSPHEKELLFRDGTTVMKKKEGQFQEEEIVNRFAESWQVRDTDPKLLKGDREPQFPSKCMYEDTPFDLRAGRRLRRRSKEVSTPVVSKEQAEEACQNAPAGDFFNACVFDTIATGDLELFEDPFYRAV